MHKQVKLITVVIMAVTMIVCALLVMDRLDGNIQVMQGKVKNAELELRQVQQKQGEITTEIAGDRCCNPFNVIHNLKVLT